ncbi:aspartate aminotransferase family protein [Nannocystaceae bacterium ST9]
MTTTLPLSDHQREHVFFTWSAQQRMQGLEIVGAERARFEVAGKGWVWDLESQVYNVAVGHRHPHVQRRMIEQIEALPAAAPNALLPIKAELGDLLARHTGLARAFLTTGGAEAVENAMKMAMLLTGRRKFIARENSYHGATLATLEVAGDPRKQPFAASMRAPLHIHDPFPARAPTPTRPSDWLESLHELIAREGGETIAAILLEGLTGTNGMQTPPIDFWPGVRAICDQHGILLIDDEIFAGFGRTGRWFAREHWGVEVDLMTIGKGLTSGYAAMAGVMVADKHAHHFDDHVLWCGLTHYAHPVGCAAAVGSLEVIEREDLPGNADRVGQLFERRFTGMIERVPALVGQRGRGLMRALELDRPVAKVVERAWELGLYLPSRDRLLFICPPLCLRDDEAEIVASLLEQSILDATK